MCVIDGTFYYDDGAAPLVVPASNPVSVPARATSTTITVTVTDYLDVLDVTIGGVPMTRVGTTDQYTATVALTPGVDAGFEIVARDMCREVTTAGVAVVFAADLCRGGGVRPGP